MKSSAPWSVKGIERDARATAKEAAKRQGMTVGEWLNQVIYTAGEPTPSDGEIEGLKLRDLVTAIEHLHKRLAEADVKGADAIGELQRQFGGFAERVQLLERVKPAEGTYDDLSERLKKIEEKGGDRQRVAALRALEKAVAQVAVQFDNAQKTSLERLDATERQVQSLGDRVDNLGGDETSTNTGALQSAVEELTERVTRAETIADEASKLKDEAMAAGDPEFVERTGERLRVLGDEIKRGGDQIRALETALGKISDQIEAAERRSADGVQKVTETISELRESFGSESSGTSDHAAIIEIAVTAARQTTETQIGALQSAVQDVANRLEHFNATPVENAATKTDENTNLENASVTDEQSTSEADDVVPLAFDAEDTKETAQDTAKDESTATDAPSWGDSSDLESIEEDDDPFSFSEDDFAALTGEPKSVDDSNQASDDFAFDLDDEDAESPAVNKDVDATSDDPMLEIADSSIAGFDTDNATESNRDALDDILADLDPLASSSDAEKASKDTMGLSAPQPSEISKRLHFGDTDDTSIGDNALSEDEDSKDPQLRPTRRTLTAKQKAILAARARQKRKAAEHAATGGAHASGAAKALNDLSSERGFSRDDEDEEQDRSSSNPAAAALSWVKGRFSRNNTTDDENAAEVFDHTESPNSLNSSTLDSEQSKLDGIKASAGARPVTLALGVAIILALGALFFLVKDIVFKPDAAGPAPVASQTAAPQNTSSAAQTSDGAASPSTTDDAATNIGADTDIINPRALYLESITALNTAESQEVATAAIDRLEEAAALGHPPAQLQLGELYKTGQGVEQDLSQARIWFRRAANGGNVLAMHRIGVLTARGDGGPADTQAAISWFERAANRGLVDSQYNLGAIYHPTETGGASLQDAGKAYYWYSLASRNGDEQAGPLAVGVASALTTPERQEINRRVAAWRAEEPDAAANEVAPAG